MPLTRKYYFGRLNTIAEYGDYDEKEEMLYGIISSSAVFNYYGYNYTFVEPEKIETEYGETFITAFLVKYSELGEDETVNPEEQSLESETVENKTKAKVRYFLNPKTGLLVYHASGNDLRQKQFRKRFEDLVEASKKEGFIQASIQTVTDEYEIFEQLDKFQAIRRLEVSLHPSNPNTNPTWDEVDEDLKDKNVNTYIEKFQSEDGLNVKDDDEVRSKLSMANDGYGKGEFEGIDEDGEEKVVATEDQPTTSEVPREEQDPSGILEYLSEPIQSIMGRFTND
jgi:hypothetical protein